MKANSMIYNLNNDTSYGYDVTEEGDRVWYFIQIDMFGNGKSLAIARSKAMFSTSSYRIVRSEGEYDINNIAAVNTVNEEDYYQIHP